MTVGAGAGAAGVAVRPATVLRDRSPRLRLLLAAGIVDSTGLAFGWTVFLLAVADRYGFGTGALVSAAGLVGVALSAPVSGRLAARLSPRDLLRILAVGEGVCRVSLFALLAVSAPVGVMLLPVVAAMNVLAFSGYAAMRAEVARVESAARSGRGRRSADDDGSGHSLTWYAVAITSSEALAAGAASLVLVASPPIEVAVAIAAVYGLSLIPQWLVGIRAPATRPPHAEGSPRAGLPVRDVAAPCLLGAAVFLVAGGPALLATLLAFQLHGAPGVVVAAVAFAVGSLAASRVQGLAARRRPAALGACALAAVMVGGWAFAGLGLAGLAVAQVLAGVALCALEGDLDARVVARMRGRGSETAGLAYAASARALGGSAAVALLPLLIAGVGLALAAAGAAAVAVAGAVAAMAWQVSRPARSGRHGPPLPSPRSSTESVGRSATAVSATSRSLAT